MAVYDLEEQDKLEDLKAWWKQWGNTIAGVVIAVCVGVIGVQGWRWWSQQQAERASVLYNAVSAAARANDVAKAKDAMAQLADKYGGTGIRAAGRADRRAAAVRDRRQGRGQGAARLGHRPGHRGRAEADRAPAARGDPLRRQAVRRRAAHARRQARRGVRGNLCRHARRHPRRRGPQRRSAQPPTRPRSRASTPRARTAISCR